MTAPQTTPPGPAGTTPPTTATAPASAAPARPAPPDPVLARLVKGDRLTRAEARDLFTRILSGAAGPVTTASALTALAMRGETVDEITGAAEAMRAAAVRIDAGPGPVVDTCGTGGDGSRTFNISTAAAIVAASAGAKVAKHGNRSATSLTGSADVLAALGVDIDAPPAVVERCLREARIGFLFARSLHGAMRHAAPVRGELGFRTIFNVLGPLTNPAGADRQVLGVARAELLSPVAEVLAALGSRRAMVVCGEDGLDELSTSAPTRVMHVADGRVEAAVLDAAELGLPRADRASMVVAGPAESAAVIRGVLSGRPGPARDIVLLNAAAALIVAGVAEDWKAGLAAAAAAVDSGAGARTLQALADISRTPSAPSRPGE